MTILDSAEALYQAKNYSGSGAWLDESGNGHDAQLGSTSGADANDPRHQAFGVRDKYIFLPRISGNFLSLPDIAAYDVTDIDLIYRGSFDAWSNNEMIMSKMSASGTSGVRFRAGGPLRYAWGDGSTFFGDISSTDNHPFSDGDLGWVRVTHDVDNGASDDVLTFYTSTDVTNDPDAVTWTQLGDVINNGAATSIGVNSEQMQIGQFQSSFPILGDMYRAVMKDGIDGTVVMDVAPTDAVSPWVSFVERSSNAATVTINRSGTARRSSVVDRAMFDLSTDDYFEIADAANLDFAAGDAGTWIVAFRANSVAAGSDVLLAKKDNLTTSLGYALVRNTANGQGIIADGTLDDDDTVATIAVNTLHTLAMVRNTTDDDIEVFLDGVGSGSATPDSTTTTLANALPVRIGATSNTAANFFEGQIVAVAQWPPGTALTDAEVLEAHNLLTDQSRLFSSRLISHKQPSPAGLISTQTFASRKVG